MQLTVNGLMKCLWVIAAVYLADRIRTFSHVKLPAKSRTMSLPYVLSPALPLTPFPPTTLNPCSLCIAINFRVDVCVHCHYEKIYHQV